MDGILRLMDGLMGVVDVPMGVMDGSLWVVDVPMGVMDGSLPPMAGLMRCLDGCLGVMDGLMRLMDDGMPWVDVPRRCLDGFLPGKLEPRPPSPGPSLPGRGNSFGMALAVCPTIRRIQSLGTCPQQKPFLPFLGESSPVGYCTTANSCKLLDDFW